MLATTAQSAVPIPTEAELIKPVALLGEIRGGLQALDGNDLS